MSTTLVSSEVCQWLALTWLGIEVMFWFIATTDWRRSMDVLSQAPEYRMDPEELIKRVLDDVESLKDSYGVENFLKGWFLGADLDDVKRGKEDLGPGASSVRLFVVSFDRSHFPPPL